MNAVNGKAVCMCVYISLAICDENKAFRILGFFKLLSRVMVSFTY